MTENDSCSYCAEINGNTKESFFLSEVAALLDVNSRQLFTSKTFLIFPSVGALVPGHLLIAPKRHITAMAHLDREELQELEGVISEISDFLFKIYNKKLVLMEHGSTHDRCSSGACVSHAHFHILPNEIKLSNSIQVDKEKIRISQLDQVLHLNTDYLLYSDDCKYFYFCEAKNFPSQYFRKVIFQASELKGHWNWILDQRIEVMRQTIDDMAQFIAKIDKKQSKQKWLQETPFLSNY